MNTDNGSGFCGTGLVQSADLSGRRYVWFATLHGVSLELFASKRPELDAMSSLVAFDTVECITSGDDACNGDHLHVVLRFDRAVSDRHVASALGSVLGVPVHPNAVQNKITGRVSVLNQYERYRRYGLRCYVNEYGSEKRLHGKAPAKPTADEMVQWAKTQPGLREVSVLAKYPCLLWQPHVLRQLLKLSPPRPPLTSPRLRNIWIHSAPGHGKNTLMRRCLTAWSEEGIRVYKFPITSTMAWMEGYDQEEVIWIDEVDPNLTLPCNMLKTISDVEETTQNVKGTSVKVQALIVLVTANYCMEECYRLPQDRAALSSRFYNQQCPHFENDADSYVAMRDKLIAHVQKLKLERDSLWASIYSRDSC